MTFPFTPKSQHPRKPNPPFLETNMQWSKPIAALMAYLMAFLMATALTACGGGTVTVGGNATVTPAAQTALTITSQPDSQTVVKGQTATFAVVASGSGTLAYQWKKNGTNIPGATASSYTTPATSNADNGAAFAVTVSNSAGSATSNATLTVTDTAIAPAIATQPADQTATTGQTATFAVKASGTSISYQWQKNGTAIAGATFSSYTTPATSSTDTGAKYTVTVSNSLGTVTSNAATLTVNAGSGSGSGSDTDTGTTITQSCPVSGSNVTATPAGCVSDGNTLACHNGRTLLRFDTGYTLQQVQDSPNVSAGGSITLEDTRYACADLAGAPVITTQPVAQTVHVGETVIFSVVATGTGTLSYQWKKNGTNISGATASTYTTPVAVSGDSGAVFTVEVSNSAGTVTSSNATLTVSRYSLVAKSTGGFYDRTECVKDNSTGLVWEGKTASGGRAGILVYGAVSIVDYVNFVNAGAVCGHTDWRMPSKNELLWIVDASQASALHIDSTWFPNTQAYWYWTSTTNESNAWGVDFGVGGFNVSDYRFGVGNAVRLVRGSPQAETPTAPAITTQPAAQTVVAHQTATFSVTATGTGPFTYQWKKNGVNITNGTGATTNSYTTPATVVGDNGAVFTVVVTNSAGTATSSSATLSVFATRYSEVPKTGGTYAKTECVKDNITGLTWEGKTASPATSRLGTSTYTNYDSTTSAQKWVGGSTYVNPTQTEIDASTNSIGYKNAVNTSTLCGYTDWRLPTKEELQGILASSGSLRIDTTWFPNTQAWYYWSSSPYVGDPNNAWNVDFGSGDVYSSYRNGNNHVRLVR